MIAIVNFMAAVAPERKRAEFSMDTATVCCGLISRRSSGFVSFVVEYSNYL